MNMTTEERCPTATRAGAGAMPDGSGLLTDLYGESGTVYPLISAPRADVMKVPALAVRARCDEVLHDGQWMRCCSKLSIGNVVFLALECPRIPGAHLPLLDFADAECVTIRRPCKGGDRT